ncbi:MAG: hypothetical protein PHP01_05395 [Phycisphaerae bacterium]|nr:hypothetical protein [Phycisphaerae bacterium]
MNQKREEKLINLDGINLYTALSMFVSAAPRCIDGILDAVEANDLATVEKVATKLMACSNRAQLAGFTEEIKNIVIAAREQKTAVAVNLAEKLKQAFEQMIKSIDSTVLEQRLQIEEFSAVVA